MANENQSTADDGIDNENEAAREEKGRQDEGADNGADEGLIDDETEEAKDDEDEGDLIEDEEDGDDANPLALDPKVAAKLTPEERKRYDQQAKGLVKLRADLEKRETQVSALKSWDDAFSNKATAVDALRQFGANVMKAHGLDPADLFPAKAKADAGKDEGGEFEFDTDKKVYEKAKADAVRETTELLKSQGMDPDTIRQFKAFMESQQTGAQKAQADAANAQRVDDILPAVMRTLKAKHDGWNPGEKAVRQALLKGDPKRPIQSVKTALVDDLLAHTAKKASTEPGPERLRGGKSPGKDLPKDPLQASARDYIKG